MRQRPFAKSSRPGLSAADETAVSTCPSCFREGTGRFCSACGEEKLRKADYSLGHFIGEIASIVTSLESNVFRSFGNLIVKPGFLTAEYFAGRRKLYLKPVQLFLFCNVIFFFLQSYTGFSSLSTPLSIHLHELPYSAVARREVDQVLTKRRIGLEEYRTRFDTTIENQSKSLVVVMIPMFAALMLPLYWRNKRYFVEHLVFSTHFYSYFLLLSSALMLLIEIAVGVAGKARVNRTIGELVFSSAVLLPCVGLSLCGITPRLWPIATDDGIEVFGFDRGSSAGAPALPVRSVLHHLFLGLAVAIGG